MTPELVIDLAKKVGLDAYETLEEGDGNFAAIQRFAQLVRNEVLEEAAKHCQACSSPPPGETQTDGQFAALHLAQQIRSLKS